MSKAIFREYIGVKPSSKSLRDFPTHIINSNISEFHFILGFAKEVYEAKKGTGVFKETWNVEYFGPEEVRILKKAKKNVKVIISIGGGDNKTPFNPAVDEDKWIKAAVESLEVIILKYKNENGGSLIDGIDINYHTVRPSTSDPNSHRFSNYIGKVITTLKNDTALNIKIVSIAPSERNSSHYRNLVLENSDKIDFVNYQFYNNYDLISKTSAFINLYNKVVADFSPVKVLPGFSTDTDGENNLQRDTFIAGCIELILNQKSPFHGIFLWNANDSAIPSFGETPTFLLEHLLQSILPLKKGISMANQSSDLAMEQLKKLLREKEELNEVATTKIQELIVELEGFHPHSIDSAEQRIIDGFTYFKLNNFNKNPKLYDQLAKGQSPKFLVFACSDSRVSPSILNFQHGEAFMVRNIANMVPAFNQLRYGGVGATIEYAITALKKSKFPMLIGHSLCGGISRLMSHPEDGSIPFDFIDDWVKIGLPAKIKVLKEYESYDFKQQCKFCEVESVNNSLVNLQTYPYVDSQIKNNNLTLFGGYYDFVNGEFKLWKYKSIVTKPITIPLA